MGFNLCPISSYVGVGNSEELQMFYYFTESESSPENDPLLLWMTGGPRCSSFYGLIYEIGNLLISSSHEIKVQNFLLQKKKKKVQNFHWENTFSSHHVYLVSMFNFLNIILGPISFQFNDLSKDPLKLVLNPYSWTKVWNFLSLGFSFLLRCNPFDGENLKIGPLIYFQLANIIFVDAPAATPQLWKG